MALEIPVQFRVLTPYAFVAQLVEQRTENPRVVGSIPTEGTNFAGLAHLVERHLAKVEVASSSLVTRSTIEGFTAFRRPFFSAFPYTVSNLMC